MIALLNPFKISVLFNMETHSNPKHFEHAGGFDIRVRALERCLRITNTKF